MALYFQSGGGKGSEKSEVEIIRYQVLIPVSEVGVRGSGEGGDESEGAAGGGNYSWELLHLRNTSGRRSEKTYLLSNSTAEFRNAFLKNIRQIIRESVRNMSLPKGPGPESSHYATPEGSDLSNQKPPSLPSHRQAQTLGKRPI